MNALEFALNAKDYGLPTREELMALRIWDNHYHGFDQHEEVMPYVDRMGIEHLFALGAGIRRRPGAPTDQAAVEAAAVSKLEQWKERVSGIVVLNRDGIDSNLLMMKRWIEEGPCIGIKYGGVSEGITCSHPDNDPVIRYAGQLGAVIYIHTWTKVGGEPRRPGGGNLVGESTPMDVALLARRFPEVPLICGHSGGDWELGARAIRSHENVLFEFSGSDPHSGQVDYAVNLLGADRIVWGGHGPSRCFATELAKVLDGDLSLEDKKKILGGNLRRIAAGIFRAKGRAIET